MGKIQNLDSFSPTLAMDIDPRPSWNTLCPSYIDSRRTKLLQDDAGSHMIGSPPPAGTPKVLWNENFPLDVPKKDTPANDVESNMDTNDLATRVQDIRLHPPQPMIICESVDDVKVVTSEFGPGSSVSLSVPPIDLVNEKKRPPY